MSHKKLKVFILFALFLIGLFVVSVILIAYSTSAALPYIFFLFGLFWAALFIPRKFSELSSTEKSVIMLSVLLVIISLTLFVNSVKIYSDKEQQLRDLQLQLDDLSKSNEYYSAYGTSLKEAIEASVTNSNLLQTKLENLNRQVANENQEKESIIQPIINLIQQEWDEEEEEDD